MGNISNILLRRFIKSNRLFYKLIPIRTLWKPRGFAVAITTRCNLRCKMCARTINNIKGDDMKFEVFEKISESFKEGMEVNFCGLGETLLHPDFFKMLDICKKKKVKFGFTTNGTLLTEDVCRRLFEYVQFNSVVISVDGVEKYWDVRKGDVNVVLRNIKGFSRMGKSFGRKVPIYINFMGLCSNITDLPILIDELKDDIDVIGILHPIIYSQDMVGEHLNNCQEKSSAIFVVAKNMCEKYGIDFLDRKFGVRKGRGCLTPFFKPYINIKGDVYPCTIIGCESDYTEIVNVFIDGKKIELIPKYYNFGNIMQDDFYDIWNNEKFMNFRKMLLKAIQSNEGYVQVLDTYNRGDYCRVCPYRWDCAC